MDVIALSCYVWFLLGYAKLQFDAAKFSCHLSPPSIPNVRSIERVFFPRGVMSCGFEGRRRFARKSHVLFLQCCKSNSPWTIIVRAHLPGSP